MVIAPKTAADRRRRQHNGYGRGLAALGAAGPSNTNKLTRNVSRSKYGVKKPKKAGAGGAAPAAEKKK